MRYLTVSLAAIGLLAGPGLASASDMPSAAIMGTNAFALTAKIYPQSRDNSPKAVIERLNRLCASSRRADQRDCEQAWRVINQAYAELQAKRAAEAAAAAGIAND